MRLFVETESHNHDLQYFGSVRDVSTTQYHIRDRYYGSRVQLDLVAAAESASSALVKACKVGATSAPSPWRSAIQFGLL